MSWLAELRGDTAEAFASLQASAPASLPDELSERHGRLGSASATMRTEAWRGPVLAWARCARLDAPPRSRVLSVLTLPDPSYDLPMFGAEIVEIGGTVTVVAIDWIPVAPDGRHLAPLADVRERHRDLPEGGELPAWAAAWFSPHAIFSRPAGTVSIDGIVHAYRDALGAYVGTCRDAEPAGDPVATWEAQRRYCDAHRRDDPGSAMLARAFGAAWSERYAEDVLFPVARPPNGDGWSSS
ncbi:MAG: hypothetical protein U5K81_13520 [Trueperaceae bacterium]|nr:hypothetical protein [Trueperaceae bacterium]